MWLRIVHRNGADEEMGDLGNKLIAFTSFVTTVDNKRISYTSFVTTHTSPTLLVLVRLGKKE